ncbi:MAG: lytic murein transglycosylase [Microvirga sp.]
MPRSACRLRIVWIVAATVSLCAAFPAPSAGQDSARSLTEARFQQWLEGVVWPASRGQGVSRQTFDRARPLMILDWGLPELELPGRPAVSGDQRQAEFQAPGAYFDEARMAALAKTGRGLLKQWGRVLDTIERRTGVPAEIVVAIWGRESHFGAVVPRRLALSVLATQAFMGRRKDLYEPELLAALAMLEAGPMPGEDLLSSWAGAMGQPQFLPSKVLAYAVDEDGDGRRDIWRSVPDSLASIAHYLAAHGWQAGRGWGVEVRVPAEVSCSLEGPRRGCPAREWRDLGILPAGGATLPEASGDARQFLLMPAGRSGPAFLVSENFYTLKAYNESDLYALFIGHVAERMQGGAALAAAWRPVSALKRGDIRDLQERLRGQGYDVGRVDGLVGFATRTAIGAWQAKAGRPETCFPDAALIRDVR